MVVNGIKSRKKVSRDDVEQSKNLKGTKSLENLKPSVFCLLSKFFGIQSSQNADVGPDIYFRTEKHKDRGAPVEAQKTRGTVAQTQRISLSQHQATQTQWLHTVENPNGSKKSMFWAYVFWLFGGIFGLHLFYLERDAHAFLTWSTLGGYGIGWLADITKIPRYVRECNNDPKFLEDLLEKMRRNKKPPFSTSRFISSLMIGYLWGQLILMAIPQDEVMGINWNTYLHWFIPLGVALGVWVVGNIGREQGKPWLTILVSYLSYTTRWYFYDENIWMTVVMFAAALTFDSFSKEWKRTPKKKRSFFRRSAALICCAILYIGIWSSYVYFNAKVTDSNGDEIPVNEALYHFFTSAWWIDFKQSLYDIYQYGQHHGWYEIWKQIIDLSDPQGEQNAYKVLGVSPTASQQEITAKWRALSREHHPDKCKDPDKLREAQDRFMEIQQAYEILSNIKTKRRRKNKKSVGKDDL